MPELDAIVCGSVTVTRDGRRGGKGEGYSDIGAFAGDPPHDPRGSISPPSVPLETLSALVLNDHAYDKLTGWSNVIPVVPVKGDATETYKFIKEESHGTRSTPHRHRT